MRRSRRYRDLYSRVDRYREYSPADAVALIRGLQSTQFSETVECHVRTGLNVRHADQQLRGTLTFPNGLGKEVRVLVFARGDQARQARDAGADFVGEEDLANSISQGWTDFDVAIATPEMMPVVGRLGRILGPQQKMPNPKVGTVTDDISNAVSQSKAGRVEYRTDRSGIVHLPIGKTDFEDRALLENYAAFLDELVRSKPAAARGRYLRTVTLATTMSPGVRVDPQRTRNIVEEPAAVGQ
jgi:large subunit ribosomal protein L1